MSLEKDNQKFNEQQIANLSFGQNGVVRAYSTTDFLASTYGYEYFIAIQLLTDCSFTKLEEQGVSGDSHSSTKVFEAGTILYGMFTEVQLSSSDMMARLYGVDKEA